MLKLACPLLFMLLLTSCASIPPNTIEVQFESNPSAAVVYSPSGKMIGLTPLTMQFPLSAAEIAAGVIKGGNATAVWYSGARSAVNTDFLLNGVTSGTVKFLFERPMNAPGALQDVEFAEARTRREVAQSQAGWESLANVITERNRQKSSLGPIKQPELAPSKAVANWTGGMKLVTTVTYQQGANCEYSYAGRTFWRTFVGSSCPSTVEVQ